MPRDDLRWIVTVSRLHPRQRAVDTVLHGDLSPVYKKTPASLVVLFCCSASSTLYNRTITDGAAQDDALRCLSDGGFDLVAMAREASRVRGNARWSQTVTGPTVLPSRLKSQTVTSRRPVPCSIHVLGKLSARSGKFELPSTPEACHRVALGKPG